MPGIAVVRHHVLRFVDDQSTTLPGPERNSMNRFCGLHHHPKKEAEGVRVDHTIQGSCVKDQSDSVPELHRHGPQVSGVVCRQRLSARLLAPVLCSPASKTAATNGK